MADDLVFDEWLNRARSVGILEAANERGAQLKRSGSAEWVGPCPGCGGTDRFGVNTRKQMFNCRSLGHGGDVIAMVQHIEGCEFLEAVESLTKEERHRGESKPLDPAVAKERQEDRRQAERNRKAEAQRDNEAKMSRAARLWERGGAFNGSRAEAYLRGRGISLTPDQSSDLRFIPSLAYHGYAEKNSKFETELGCFPAMLAAVRNVTGDLIGVHRTYLSPDRAEKLSPPGYRNGAKKVYGLSGGGMIRLGPIGPRLAIGEGIETTASFFLLGYGPEDLTMAAAYALGNISGSSTASLPHPDDPRQSIQNGIPDMSNPGLILPDEVEEVYLLGDGDNPAATRAKLLTGARRFRALGKTVFICMAPHKLDFNDVLQDEGVAA